MLVILIVLNLLKQVVKNYIVYLVRVDEDGKRFMSC